nr:MAG TPA: hypothetical protein [Caudoviricetes sp.]
MIYCVNRILIQGSKPKSGLLFFVIKRFIRLSVNRHWYSA